MINKFSTVYAGHVDLGDMGQQATPANERRYANEHLASVFTKAEAIARCMDDHGYHALWLAEHHFQHEGYECIPNILMAAVHLAHLTSRLRIGCGFNWKPILASACRKRLQVRSLASIITASKWRLLIEIQCRQASVKSV